jgi:hypothetical protein
VEYVSTENLIVVAITMAIAAGIPTLLPRCRCLIRPC